MSENLKLWDSVSRVPKEHLKPFNNGRFAGTAIKPMFFIKTMTEQFGVCGQGWFIDKPEFQLVDAGESKLVYSTVAVWVQGGQRVYGIGGDWAVRNGKGEDEAFKKAYTDALTNALVKLGVGADIHMGLWDGNKYVAETAEATSKPKLATVTGEPAAPKAASREPYDKISKGIKTIRDTGTNDDLTNWYRGNAKTIEGFPADWHQMIMEEFSTAREALNAKAA